ncbi:hypothetical protein OHC33_001227 [Knufia fluminis]|uniref:Uncharacterized protein n=2 Tax=Knufia TaxID=430999 RepID=A0AAN8I7C8_9EURO|nr:hypothetical protein OHC33_001227 [Knufia fluminis]
MKTLTSPEGLRDRYQCWKRGEDRELFLKAAQLQGKRPGYWHEFAQAMLDPLCDLQSITGAGIVIAALAKREGQGMSFYHQVLVGDYWWLTFSSLWSARQDVRAAVKSGQYSKLRLQVRQVAVLVTVGLAVGFLSKSIWLESHEWDLFVSGKCYRTHDVSPYGFAWFWIAGLCFAEVTATAQLLSDSISGAFDEIDVAHRRFEGWKIMRCRECAGRALDVLKQTPTGGTCFTLVMNLLKVVVYACIVFLSFVSRQVLSFWALGPGTPAVKTLFYIAFFCWNTADLIAMRAMNAELLKDQGSWGFGQVLPVVLIASTIFMAVDAHDRVKAP